MFARESGAFTYVKAPPKLHLPCCQAAPSSNVLPPQHALAKHSYDSPSVPGVTRFPKGTFGFDDNDLYAMIKAVTEVTHNNEPMYDEEDESVWYFQGIVNGVLAEVPVRRNDQGIWEIRTIYPMADWGQGGTHNGTNDG